MSSSYMSNLMGGGSLNHSFVVGQSFDELNSASAASSGNLHSNAALSHLLSQAASSPYTFDSTAASFLSKYVGRPPPDAITTASVIPSSPGSASGASATATAYPMAYQSSMSAASLRLKSGSSCHQCKTNKDPPHLYFCSTKQDTATGKRNCRKKYCAACMQRWYKQLGMTGVPGIIPPNGPGWSCPSCLGQCVCAACDRKKEKANRKAAEEGGAEVAATDESIKSDCEGSCSDRCEATGESEVCLGVKRERSDMCESDEGGASHSPAPKHAKMEISPPLSAVSASAIAFSSSEQKDRSPSTLVLPRPPPGYNRLQSEPNMPAFASPSQHMRNVTASPHMAQAIVAPLPPHARAAAQQHSQSRATPAAFQVPALPISSSSASASSTSSSSSSSPLYFDPMQEAVRAISRFYHSQQQQQQHMQASKLYHTPATTYDHMRRGSEDVPSLTNFSSSNSSSVSTPVPNTPPTHFTAQEDTALAFALDSAPTGHVTAATAAAGGVGFMKLKMLPAQPLPMLTTASRAITVPVTNGETDRHTAVRAIQSIGLLNFDTGGPSPPTLSLAASPSLSPVVSVPSSPRSLNAWRSSLSLTSSSAQLGSTFDVLTSDPFHPSPLFNPLLPGGVGSTSSTNTPRNLGGQTPVQFWIKSGINSLCGTPRAGHLAAVGSSGGQAGRAHGSRGGSMGEMEFQALFN